MRRTAFIIVGFLAGLLLLTALVCGGAVIAGNTAQGRHFIEQATSRLTRGRVRLLGLGGSFPSAPTVQQLQLRDRAGLWLEAENLQVRWTPLALLEGRVQVQTAHASSLTWERLPVSKSKSSSKTPRIPQIDVGALSVDRALLSAHLAGSAAALRVQGSAHLRSLHDMRFEANATRIGGEGSYFLRLQFDSTRMDGTLKLQEPAHGPLESLLGYADLGALSASGSLNGPRDAERLALQLDADPLHASVTGLVDLKRRAGDLSWTLATGAMTPRPRLSWKRLQSQGQWHGTLTHPRVAAQLQIEALALADGLKLAALNATVTANGGELATRGRVEGLMLPGPRPQLLRGAPITVDGSVQLDQAALPFEISASHPLLAVRARGLARGRRSVDVDLSFPDLGTVAAGTAVAVVRGSATAHAHVEQEAGDILVQARAQARLGPVAAPWAAALGATPSLQFAGSLVPGTVRIDKLTATGRGLKLSLSGSLPLGAAGTSPVKASGSLTLPDLALLSPALAGSLTVTAKTSGAPRNLSVAATVDTTVSVHGSPAGSITANLKATGLPSAPAGQIAAQGSLDGAPIQLQLTALRERDGTVHAIVRQASWKSLRAEANLSSTADLASARGTVSLAIPHLQDLQHLLGMNISGSVEGALRMVPAGTSSAAHLRLQAHDIVTDAFSANATLEGDGSLDALHLDLSAQSSSVAGGPASVSSQAVLNLGSRRLGISKLAAQVHGISLQLQQPSTIDFASGLRLTSTRIAAGGAVLSLEGELLPALDLSLALHDVSPALVNALRPDLLAAGRGTVDARLTGTLKAPVGRVQLGITGARIAGEPDGVLPAADVSATVDLAGDHAELTGELRAGKTSEVTIKGRVPWRGPGMLGLTLKGKADIALINPLLEAHGRQAGGLIGVDATVTGTTTAPVVSGSVSLAQGTLHDYALGIELTDITGTLQGTQDRLRITTLTARAASGNISITGTVGVLEHGTPVDLHLTATNARPISSSIVTADLDADLSLTGSLRQQMKLAGTLSVHRATVAIPGSFPPNVAVLNVRLPGQQEVVAPTRPGPVVLLDVRVRAPRQILVSGRGLDAELGGQIHVGGTVADPVVTGGFDLLRGIFTLSGSRLTFSSGRIGFAGAGLKGRIDPTLDFTAQSSVQDNVVTLHIGGFADAPQFELSSVPQLPQDEILALLLFGENASQLTALQAAETAAALTSLTGGSGGMNPLVAIQKRLGLDRLSVGSNDTGTTATNTTQNSGATIEAGRYVTSRIFVDLKQDTTGSTQVQMDVDLTRHLKLQTRLGDGTATVQGTTPDNDPGSSLGLSYGFEY